MRTLRALMVGAAAFAVIGLSSSAAMAVTFGIEVSVGFVPPGTCDISATGACLGFDGTGGTGAGAFTGTGTRMQWDVQTTSVNSFLAIGALPDVIGFPAGTGTPTGFAAGVINPGETVTTAQIRHTNNTMPDTDDFLSTVTVRTLLELRAPDNTLLLGGIVDVPLTFVETDNVGGPVDDVFTFAILDTDIPFSFDGINYILQLRGLVDENGDPACTLGAPGFVNCPTSEGIANDRFVQITLIQLSVPAPATLLLVGLGLVGAGVLPLLRRRRAA